MATVVVVVGVALGTTCLTATRARAAASAGHRQTAAHGAPMARRASASQRAWVPHRVVVGYRVPTWSPAPMQARLAGFEAASRPLGGPTPRGRRAALHTRVVRVPAGESVRSAIARLRRRRGVAYAEPDYVAHAAGMFYPDDRGAAGVPHGWVRQQWDLLPRAGVDAPEAWANLLADGRPGGRGVTVAVLDTGVAYRNWGRFRVSPDLRQTRFVAPHDFVADNRFPLDRDGHGTLVASVIAEATNNRIGLTGLAYGASIMPLRVLNAAGEGNASTIAEAIRYAVAHGADIINMSFEFLPSQVRSGRQIPEVVSAIRDARRHDVMVVAAAGNDDLRELAYPARVRGVVAVGATTRDGCLANYSNSGPSLDLVAPGGGPDALQPHDPACHPSRTLPPIYQMTLSDPPHWSRFGYPSSYIGTSMSAPLVAAAAALVISSRVIGPNPTPNQVLHRLEQTATPLPRGSRGRNSTYGYGLLDAGAATQPMATANAP
ncbi:MAG TPA: S8 family serine peptidase [Solirubrobacteraceae bacterium]|nr:S8 family serine peptidase [Solirubrobacteraceae bacterium]